MFGAQVCPKEVSVAIPILQLLVLFEHFPMQFVLLLVQLQKAGSGVTSDVQLRRRQVHIRIRKGGIQLQRLLVCARSPTLL